MRLHQFVVPLAKYIDKIETYYFPEGSWHGGLKGEGRREGWVE